MANMLELESTATREFTLQFLEQITDDFSEEHVIGRGGYGVVYKGVLEHGEEIALKKLHFIPGLDDKQFRNEYNNLMRAQHPNIIRLVGYCYHLEHQRIKHEGNYVFAHVEERVLCFEYLQGGSLDTHISDESCGLDWDTRFKIIKGICEGLNYLHNGSQNPIYHLDLKPENILLDKNMVPKIGDFGLSRLFPSAQTQITTKIIGTRGYMPPEYIDRYEITPKYDIFSLGVIIIRIIAGYGGYSKCVDLSSEELIEHVHENWRKRLQGTMSSHTSEQVKACIKIALTSMEIDRKKRPTITEIIEELKKVDTTESLPAGQVANFPRKHALSKYSSSGSIVFSATYRPAVPFDIFCSPFYPTSAKDELQLTDGVSYNYNGSPIPPAALKTLIKRPKLEGEGGATDADIDAGRVSGLIFVSERDDGLETLYISLYFNVNNQVKVFALSDIFGANNFSGARLEDSGCIGGGYSVGSRAVDHCLIYVSTKEPVLEPRSPWTVVYKTNLTTGKTDRLTPKGMFDLSPAVSPSGKLVAVASFENNSWNGEIENLKTDIYVMNVDIEEGLGRKLLIKDGGWPSWGSDNIIFFHRRSTKKTWGVFRYDISTDETIQVTPSFYDAMTPAAINETNVAVATIVCKPSPDVPSTEREETEYRHIEIFDTDAPLHPVQVTQKMRPRVDHYNPFVLYGGIGYHRCRSDLLQFGDNIAQNLHKVESSSSSSMKDAVGLFHVSGVFPTISKDGTKLAFVDKELKEVWLADSQGLRIVYNNGGPADSVFAPVWNQNPDNDILYVCIGPSFGVENPVEIYAIHNVSGDAEQRWSQRLTHGGFNNAFPSSSPDGSKIVFRSTRDSLLNDGIVGRMFKRFIKGYSQKSKNLYIMLTTDVGESQEGWLTRLTKGPWIDTQCQWSPNGDWIVFSSTRDKPDGAEELDNGLDPGYFSLYLVKPNDYTVVIRVMSSGGDLGGHINHPVFSPDGMSIAVTADLAAVSVDPVSLPMCSKPMRPYGDIFVLDIDPDVGKKKKKKKNKDVIKACRRITHSRYECGTPAWTTTLLAMDPNAQPQWNILPTKEILPRCPYIQVEGGEGYRMTGHLCILGRRC